MAGFNYQVKRIGHYWERIYGIIFSWFLGQDDVDVTAFQQVQRFVRIKGSDLQQDVGKFLVKPQQDRPEKNGKKNRIRCNSQSRSPPFVQMSYHPASLI